MAVAALKKNNKKIDCPKCGDEFLAHFFIRHINTCISDEAVRTAQLVRYSGLYPQSKSAEVQRALTLGKPPQAPVPLLEPSRFSNANMTAPDKPPALVDTRIAQFAEDTALKEQKLRLGAVIDVIVDSIEVYGVLVHVNSSLSLTFRKGLIHKTQIIPGRAVTNLAGYFRPGETIKAQITEIKKDGKLSLSLKGIGLPAYIPIMPEQQPLFVSQVPPVNPVMAEKLAAAKEQMDAATKGGGTMDQQALEFIKMKVGVISPQAHEKLEELHQQHGTFKFMFSLFKAAEQFNVDLGLAFAKEMESKMGECL